MNGCIIANNLPCQLLQEDLDDQLFAGQQPKQLVGWDAEAESLASNGSKSICLTGRVLLSM